MTESVVDIVERAHREHFGTLVAPLIRILGSFAAAEDVVQEVFASALETWTEETVPAVPLAWLRRAAKNRAIDHVRSQGRKRDKEHEIKLELDAVVEPEMVDERLADDSMRLIFTCCHPSLAPEAQIALTLRTVCGLTSEQIARAFLIKPTTLQQRVVRAKKKIEAANIPYLVPEQAELPERIGSVLRVIYLIFNEGYGASAGDRLIRHELCDEAIRLGRLLVRLMPDAAAPKALLALMLLHHSRSGARTTKDGELVLLPEQDRSQWDFSLIEEALPLVEAGLKSDPVSTYGIEAAIAALHAQAPTAEDTDWPQIAALYQLLAERSGEHPVVQLNAAVAVALSGNLASGLAQLERLADNTSLQDYHLLHAARGDLLLRAGRIDDSRAALMRALELAPTDAERRYLRGRLDSITDE